jgi:hypothetical protein
MRTATIRLHERLISLFKGAIKAWEEWLGEVKQENEPPKA